MLGRTELTSALARLETRWGSAAVRLGGTPDGQTPVSGSLALAPSPAAPAPPQPAGEVLPTGFAALDALLGSGGLPRGVSVSLRGGRSSGKTTLALHCLAQAQAQGAIVAFLDFGGTFDPLEAAARGVDLHWLLVLRPVDLLEGFELGAALVNGHQLDMLVVDLPARLAPRHEQAMRRLLAHARRQSVRLIVLEPGTAERSAPGALADALALRLELEQRAWLRAGRDVVGRRVRVRVAKNRFGPPGREAELEIRYLVDGEHAPAVDRFAAPA